MKRNGRTGRVIGVRVLFVSAVMIFSLGCAAMQPEKPKTLTMTDRGTVLFLDKYEFKRPPANWSLLKNLEGGDFELGFMLMEKGDFPSQTTFMYDEEPYGSSQNLADRARYYCTRFLFNSGVEVRVTKEEKATVAGHEAIALYLEGDNPNRDEKAKSKVYLVKRGNRIVSFVCTMWRPMNGTYAREPFDYFETFVNSFTFLKKDFYENFEEELKKQGL